MTLSYENFYRDHTIHWTLLESYGCIIYEGDFDWFNGSGAEWIRGDWVASVDFYTFHEAASVSIDNSASGLDFGLSSYYCSIDWEPLLVDPQYGYFFSGLWHPAARGEFNVNGWVYCGNEGTPRFHYLADCPVDIPWPSPAPPRSRTINPRDLFLIQ